VIEGDPWLDYCVDKVTPKSRGFAFVTYSTQIDAQDAIDNMDLNEFRYGVTQALAHGPTYHSFIHPCSRSGRVIRVNLARPQKGALANGGYGRASE
jgi:peptidyl-prolyl isomerase E (cyclophilin E)